MDILVSGIITDRRDHRKLFQARKEPVSPQSMDMDKRGVKFSKYLFPYLLFPKKEVSLPDGKSMDRDIHLPEEGLQRILSFPGKPDHYRRKLFPVEMPENVAQLAYRAALPQG